MENETRSSRSQNNTKTSKKFLVGMGLVFSTILIGALAGVWVANSRGSLGKEEAKSVITRVESENTAANDNATTEQSTSIKVADTNNGVRGQSTNSVDSDGTWEFGQEFGENETNRTFIKPVELGYGRDDQGKRDAVVNNAVREYDLGNFISEDEYMPNGVGGTVKVKYNVAKIYCTNGYMYVSTFQQLNEHVEIDGKNEMRDLETPNVSVNLLAVYKY